MLELLIQNGNTLYEPVVEGTIDWDTEWKKMPGKLSFTVQSDGISIVEGNAVRFKSDQQKVFYGFIFKIQRGKVGSLKITAYDQLRYLKNKDTYLYSNKKANELVSMLAGDFNLQTGILEDTGFVISSRIEDNKTLFDIVGNALDLTLQHKRKMFILYDDFGELTLRNIESMGIDLLVGDDTAEDYDLASSIDGETYNKIKLSYANEDTGKREVYVAQDAGNMNAWGTLQYYDTIDENVNGKAKADALLQLLNRKDRKLSLKNALGDPRVRAGCSLGVLISDAGVKQYMVVEKVKHRFSKDTHFMDLTMRGDVIV